MIAAYFNASFRVNTTIIAAQNISNKLSDYSDLIAIGINQTNNRLLEDIGDRIYNKLLFNDYTYNKETPLLPYLQDVLCRMGIKGKFIGKTNGLHTNIF
jgi:hypothetical protein